MTNTPYVYYYGYEIELAWDGTATIVHGGEAIDTAGCELEARKTIDGWLDAR